MSLNRVEISGGLVRDAEFTHLPSGAPVWEATVVVNEAVYSAKERASVVRANYIAVNAFGEPAERLASEGLQRGDEVYILGALNQTTIERKDGSKESKTKVRVLTYNVTRRRHPGNATPQGGFIGQNNGGGYDPNSGQGGWPNGVPPF